MLKFFLKNFVRDKVRLTLFNQAVVLKLLKKALAQDQIGENYLYEFGEAVVQKTVEFMQKKQGAIDAMWLQRGLVQENSNFIDTQKLARGSSTVLRGNHGKNYLNDNDLNSLKKVDRVKAQIIQQTHRQLEVIYKKAILSRGKISQSQELTQIGETLSRALDANSTLTFHRGSIACSPKIYFRKTDRNTKISSKTGIVVFDENIDLLIKGEEFAFNFKIAEAIEESVGGKFYILNPYAKNYQPLIANNILNTGVYDLPHLGHASKIKNLKNLLNKNGKLVIALTNDKNAQDLKNKQIVFSAQDRKMIIESLNYANKVLIEPEQSQIFQSFYASN